MRSEKIKKHLCELSKIIIHGSQRVFISKSVGNLLRTSTYFCWLPPEPTPASSGNVEHLKLWDNEVKKSVYCHTHFARWDNRGVEAKKRERPEIKKLCAT